MQGSEEWSFAVGLRRAVVYTLGWGAISAVMWCGALYASAPLLDSIQRSLMRITLIPTAAMGALIGWLLVRKLSDAAGFAGWPLVVMAGAMAVTVILGGLALVHGIQPLPLNAPFALGGPACIAAVVVIIMVSLQDM